MEQRLFKKLLLIFGILTLITALLIIPAILQDKENMMRISMVAYSIFLLMLFITISIKYFHVKKFRSFIGFSIPVTFFLLIISALLTELSYIRTVEIIYEILLPSSVILFIFTSSLGLSFILSKNKLQYVVITLICLTIIGFVFKRYHWPLAGAILTLSFFGLGFCSFGQIISNFSGIKMNRYLLIVNTICYSILTFISFGTIFKLQHWPGGNTLLNISIIPMIIITLIVLITLPGSKFMEWSKEHKALLSRTILIPWIFFLIFISTQFLLPEKTRQMIFSKDASVQVPFGLRDYQPENKNGLE